ncbi:MAG: aldehyde dehydrogenase family protein [Myxococcaceae bacterium]
MNAAAAQAPTPVTDLDRIVRRVKEGSRAFARLTIDERIRLAEELREGFGQIAEESVRAACAAKGIDFDSPLSGEEWLAGPMVTIRNLRLLTESLIDIKRGGAPRIEPSWVSTLPDGRLSVRVYPSNGLEAMLMQKHEAEVHLQPGVTADRLRESQASFYRTPHDGRLCLVLGAGNVNAIPPTDAVYKLFVEGTAVVLKMNPVNEYLGPFIERAFKPAIERGFFAVVYGGEDVGKYLVEHALVDEVHITGSDKTHDLMVWGPPGPEREARKRRKDPLLKKEITSELGNVTPVIVVPGPYTDAELQHQADNIAGMVTNNASFNCNAAKLLVLPKGWAQREKLLGYLEQSLQKGVVRRAYYPGAEERWKQLTQGRRGLKLVGEAGPGELPYALITQVDPSNLEDDVFRTEPWCAVLSEVELGSAEPREFLEAAVPFVNAHVWGTLACSLIVHPKTQKDAELGPAVEKAIRELRYGSVAVNTWGGATFGLASPPWGGHPSSTLEDIQSGRGWVHNTYMLENIEKVVLRAPLKGMPPSPWFPGHRTLNQVGRKLVLFELEPSWLKIPGLAAAAMRA